MADIKSGLTNITRTEGLVIIIGIALAAAVFLLPFDLLVIAREVAAPWFAKAYVAMLVVITLMVILKSRSRLLQEKNGATSIINVLRDQSDAEDKLHGLNWIADARIITNEYGRTDALSNSEIAESYRTKALRSGILQATSILLGGVTATPVARHGVEGLRPAADILAREMGRRIPRASDRSDMIVRLALLGTFIGLIAALTIASANAGVVQGNEQAQTAHMRDFIQQLLGTAGAKFWISAAGMACALVLRAWQGYIDKAVHKLVAAVGLEFDRALADPEVAGAWCPKQDNGLDPVSAQIRKIAEEIKKSADNWVLTIEIGANPDSPRQKVALRRRPKADPG